MAFEDDYLAATGSAFSEMHVIIEGAISIFEDDTTSLIRLCKQHGDYDAFTAFNDIGGSLYSLRRFIKHLQVEHHKEVERLCAEHHPPAE